MTTDLTGRRVLAIVTNYGIEQDELVKPVEHLRQAGAHVDIAATTLDPIETLVDDKKPGQSVTPTITLDDADPAAYGLLLVPGGTINADTLRTSERAIEIVRSVVDAHGAIAAICHAPWTLVESKVVSGKKLTSFPSLRTDVVNAGGDWVDQSVVRDDSSSWTLITSRNPDDIPDFLREIDKVLESLETPQQPVL